MSKTYTVIAPSDADLPPPPGVVPDFEDPFTISPYWTVTAALCLVLTGSLLALRMYTKIVIVKKVRWEDYTCCLAFLFFAAWISQIFAVVNYGGGGVHQWNLTSRDMAQQYKFYNTADMVYSPAVGFTKISILLLVLRIFCPVKRNPFYWILQCLNILNTVFYLVYFLIPFVLCRPRVKIWLPNTPGHCLQVFDLYISSAAFNIVSDIAMYSVPFWRIWHLQLSKGRKLGMTAIFATGGFAIAFAVFRLAWAILLLLRKDFSYVKLQGTIWALAELACGLICSCLFVLPRLYRHLVNAPPTDSEEFKIRKWKHMASSKKVKVDDSQLQQLHLKEEQHNPWERDIELPEVVPAKSLLSRD